MQPFHIVSSEELSSLGANLPESDLIAINGSTVLIKCLDSVNTNTEQFVIFCRLDLPVIVAPVIEKLTGFNPIYI